MTVTLHAQGEPVTLSAPTDQVVASLPDHRVFMALPVMETAMAAVRLHGKDAAISTVGALLASDNVESAGWRLSRDDRLAESFPQNLLAHLLATPARMRRLMPQYTPVPSEDYLAAIEETPTPHTLLVGASGQGKSTALARIGQRDMARERTLVVVDVHDGDLVRRLRDEAARQDRPCLFVDFGEHDSAMAPVLRIADPPPGVNQAAHLEDLWTMLRDDVWADIWRA
jgi:hypothetical protein